MIATAARKLLAIFAALSLCNLTSAFVPLSSSSSSTTLRNCIHTSFSTNPSASSIRTKAPSSPSQSLITLHAEKKDSLIADYEERGKYLFAFVMAAIIWSFSIPPEIRRQHLCFSRNCRLDNTGKFCYDCISFGEYTNMVKEYYQGGGGIKFDFSIDKKE